MLARWNQLLESVFPETWMRVVALLVLALVVGWILRWILAAVVVRLVKRSGTDLDDKLLAVLRRPIFLSVVLIGIAWAGQVAELPQRGEEILLQIVWTLAVLVWMVAGLRLCHVFVDFFARLADRVEWIQPQTVPLVENLGRVALVGVVAYLLLMIWQLDAAPWLASAGVVGIALGFAAKDTLANLFGGFFIIIDAPYKLGDYINLDTGERGAVTKIGLRSTRILTRDDIEITIPNATISNSKSINEAGGRWLKSRIRIKVGVAYGSDLKDVRKALMGAADEVEYCLKDPEPRVRFRALGQSSLDFELMVWIERPELRGRCTDALLTYIYERFRRDGIEIPFPQRDLHVRSLPQGWSRGDSTATS